MKTCCIVDDDDIFKLILKKELEISGAPDPILEFEDGSEALEHFKTLNPDYSVPEVIFLDIKMYKMSGWDFLTAFSDVKKRFNKEIDIYLMSNSILKSDQEQAIMSPLVTEYLTKPISISKLKAILYA